MQGESLAEAKIGQAVRIVRLMLEREPAAWLSAVGLHEGEALVVLRHAAWGGPLHVRTESQGEFAIARDVAQQIVVEAMPKHSSP